MQSSRIKLSHSIFIAFLTFCLSAGTNCFGNENSIQKNADTTLSTLQESVASGDLSERNLILLWLKNQSNGDFSQDVVALHQLLLVKPNWSEIDFIEQKAKSQNLKGYEYNEWQRIRFFVEQYIIAVIISIITLLVGAIGYGTYSVIIKKTKASWTGLLIPVILILFILYNQSIIENPEGYTHAQHTLLFKTPSPAAEIVNEVNFGERIQELRLNGEWFEGRLNSTKVYVRKQDLTLFYK
jgi:hypothetical protein